MKLGILRSGPENSRHKGPTFYQAVTSARMTAIKYNINMFRILSLDHIILITFALKFEFLLLQNNITYRYIFFFQVKRF